MNIDADQKDILGKENHYLKWAVLVPLVFFGFMFFARHAFASTLNPSSISASVGDSANGTGITCSVPGNNVLVNVLGSPTSPATSPQGNLPPGITGTANGGTNTLDLTGTYTTAGTYVVSLHCYADETDVNITFTISGGTPPPAGSGINVSSMVAGAVSDVGQSLANGFVKIFPLFAGLVALGLLIAYFITFVGRGGVPAYGSGKNLLHKASLKLGSIKKKVDNWTPVQDFIAIQKSVRRHRQK